ncbi:hypothetical protein [Myxosarcina sp. GI1]|uniref:hypothetical protein n=1 Tax=Myxosarcina sp. GI1 TaxID=1541065 RepID=UPI00055AE438|nr:hypothetical protein [Myxosarcina sp. GI1]
MKRQFVLGIVLFFFTLGLVLVVPRLATSQETQVAMCGGDMMGGGMMNDRMMRDGMMGGNREDMQIVHRLFANHDQIRRTVEEIPGGVRTLTESDNPQITALIQAHVQSMHQRVDEGRWFAMMSRTLPTMFRNADRYQRQNKNTSKGISVTKTSDDPDLVAVLREHSREVSGFVEGGMPCMGGGMMRGR